MSAQRSEDLVPESQIGALWEIIRKQQAALERMEARLAQLAGDAPGGSRTEPCAEEAVSDVAVPSVSRLRTVRRSLLKSVGAGAAAVVGAGLLAAEGNLSGATQRAEAAGGPLTIDTVNTGAATTSLNAASGATPQILFSLDNSATPVPANTTLDFAAIVATGPAGGSGIVGISNTDAGFGVYGRSDVGFGVTGFSGGGVDIQAGGPLKGGRFLQNPFPGLVGAPVGQFAKGEQIRDSNGDMFLAVTDGTATTNSVFNKVAVVRSGFTGGAIHFLASPFRLLDTRPNQPSATARSIPLPANQTVTFPVAGISFNGQTIPAQAVGIIGNLTVTDQGGGINVRVFAGDAQLPLASSITAFPVTPFLANNVVSRLSVVSPAGQISLHADNFSVDVIFDITAVIM